MRPATAMMMAFLLFGCDGAVQNPATDDGGDGADLRHHQPGGSGGSGGAGGMSGGASGSGGTAGSGGATGSGGASGSGGAAGSGGSTGGSGTTMFPSTSPWYQDISNAAKDASSDSAIAALAAKGWGTGKMQIDFSITVQHASASTPLMSFQPTSDFYTPDCDQVAMPVPPGGALEGETGYACTQDGDCHLLVIDDAVHKLYEMWRANITGGTFYGGCLAVWDLTRDYGQTGRGDGCTSADAGGFPITALLFTADEVAAGHIDHAIRFILPNDRILHGTYVHPGTHATNAASSTTSLPYGARLRLRADYPVSSLPAGAQVVARAMQKYGMFLSDGGNIALTAASDQFTTAKWSGLLGAKDLAALQVSDFEMVDGGTRYTTSDCTRLP